MGALLALVPLPWKIGGIVLLALGLITGYEAWAFHQRSIGAARVEAADAKAVAAQKTKDAATSAKLAVTLQAQLNQLSARAASGNQKIELDPVEPGSQAELDAAATVRCLLDASLCK